MSRARGLFASRPTRQCTIPKLCCLCVFIPPSPTSFRPQSTWTVVSVIPTSLTRTVPPLLVLQRQQQQQVVYGVL